MKAIAQSSKNTTTQAMAVAIQNAFGQLSGEAGLHLLQHDPPPARLVLFGADIGLKDFAGQLHREFFVALFFLGEVAEQAAYADIVSLLCGLDVELLGLQLHRLDLLSDGVERQVLRQPDRAPSQKSLDVLAAE